MNISERLLPLQVLGSDNPVVGFSNSGSRFDEFMLKGHCLLLGTVEYCTVSSTMLIVITFEADLWTFAWGVYSSVTPDAIISISYNNPLPNPQKSIALPCYSLKGVGMTWHNCFWNVCGEIHSGFHSAVIAIKASLTAGIWDGDAAAFKWRSQIDFLTSFHFYVPTITKQYIQVADCNLRVLPQNLPKWYLMIGLKAPLLRTSSPHMLYLSL